MMQAALITGGAKRIGAGIALKLASMGYDIALHYNKSRKEAEELKRLLEKEGITCKIFQCDLSKEREVEGFIKKVKNEFSALCLLVNSAAIFKRAGLRETDNEMFNETFDINFKAPFILSRDFAKIVEKGDIVNIIDTKIAKNNYIYLAYTLTKKCLAEFTRMSANELGSDIRVNGIAPGLILEPEGKTEEYLAGLAKTIPLKEKGSIKDITDALAFLLTNKYITGQIIYVDGGEHL